jgi:hypothetical protein
VRCQYDTVTFLYVVTIAISGWKISESRLNNISENMNVEKIYAELKKRIDRVGIEVV